MLATMLAASSPFLLHHSGPFSLDVVVARGRELRALPGLSENARHRLFAVFVELAQNIGRYSAARVGVSGADHGAGEITISAATDGEMLVAATNLVSQVSGSSLAAQLDALAVLDAVALKTFHRDRRRAAPPPGSLGAGLGLIELARHASAPIGYDLTPGPEGLAHFTVHLRLATT